MKNDIKKCMIHNTLYSVFASTTNVGLIIQVAVTKKFIHRSAAC